MADDGNPTGGSAQGKEGRGRAALVGLLVSGSPIGRCFATHLAGTAPSGK